MIPGSNAPELPPVIPDPPRDADAAWGQQFAERPPGQAAPEPPKPEDDVFSEDSILNVVGMILGARMDPETYEHFAEKLGIDPEPAKAKRNLKALNVGQALADLGIRPSRGIGRMPPLVRLLAAAGSLFLNVREAHEQATGNGGPANPRGPGIVAQEAPRVR